MHFQKSQFVKNVMFKFVIVAQKQFIHHIKQQNSQINIVNADVANVCKLDKI